MRVIALLLLFLGVAPALPAGAATEDVVLMMAEEPGCVWCARWNEEIGPIYPNTAEGRAAPLERFDLYTGEPTDVTFTSRIRFTPTFILVHDNQEVGRIEGYPGEDFFWGLLARMLEDANIRLD